MSIAAVTSSHMYSLLHCPRIAVRSVMLMLANFSRKYVRKSSLTVVFAEKNSSRSNSVPRFKM
eukprot:3232109-Pyramimonas_sp.AAC.1